METKNKTKTAKATPEVSPELKELGADASSALTLYGENPLELVLPDTMHESDYLAYGSRIGAAMKFASWRIGDFINFGMVKFSYKDYEKVSGVTGLPEDYLRQCASVAGRVSVEFRADASLEKARLMLQNKGANESIAKLFKRLGAKTHKQLRKMKATGSGGGGGDEPITAGELYKQIEATLDMMEKYNTGDAGKMAILASYEHNKETGGQLASLSAFAKAMAEQLTNEHPPKE